MRHLEWRPVPSGCGVFLLRGCVSLLMCFFSGRWDMLGKCSTAEHNPDLQKLSVRINPTGGWLRKCKRQALTKHEGGPLA